MGEHNRKSKVAAIDRWSQRRLICVCGFDEIFFNFSFNNNACLSLRTQEDMHD